MFINSLILSANDFLEKRSLKCVILFLVKKSKTSFLSANPEEGVGAGDESSEVREDRRHVQPDLPQRRVCASQSQSSLWSYAHLRKTTFYLITFYLITFVQLFLPILIPLKSPHWISV